jgi:hypothetical protein
LAQAYAAIGKGEFAQMWEVAHPKKGRRNIKATVSLEGKFQRLESGIVVVYERNQQLAEKFPAVGHRVKA